MLLVFTLLFKSLIPDVDVTIGDYKPEPEITEEAKTAVDGRLSMIQNEDQGRDFSQIMEDTEKLKTYDAPQMTSALNVKTSGKTIYL